MRQYNSCVCQKELDSYREKNNPEKFLEDVQSRSPQQSFNQRSQAENGINNDHIENKGYQDIDSVIFRFE